MDKKSITKIAKKLLEILVYIAVAYFLYTKLAGNFDKLSEIEVVDIPLLVASILVFSMHSVFNGLNWNYMLRSGGHETKLPQQMDVYLRSYILRYIPGNVVGILSRAIYNREHKVPMIASLWGWFLENITYLVLGLVIGAFVIPQIELTNFVPQWVVIVAIAIGIFMIVANDWLKILFNKLLVPRLPKEAQEEFVSLDIPLKNRLILTVRYFVSWAIYSVSFILLSMSLGLEFNLLLIPINALAWSLGYLSLVTPSGSGVREGVMVYLLTNALAVDGTLAVVVSIVARIVFIVGELLSFGAFYIYKLVNKKNV